MDTEDMQDFVDAVAIDKVIELLEKIARDRAPASPLKIIALQDYAGGTTTRAHVSNNRFQVMKVIISNSAANDVGIRIGSAVYHFYTPASTIEIPFEFTIDRGINISIVPSAASNVDVYLMGQVEE